MNTRIRACLALIGISIGIYLVPPLAIANIGIALIFIGIELLKPSRK